MAQERRSKVDAIVYMRQSEGFSKAKYEGDRGINSRQKVLWRPLKAYGAREPKILLVTGKFFEGVSLHCKNVYSLNTNKISRSKPVKLTERRPQNDG